MLQKVDEHKTSIQYAYKAVAREQRKIEAPPLPYGEYDVIYADPPWKHYSVMSDEELRNLKIPTAENAMLFLWPTSPKLKDAIELMEAWGFKYRTSMVWIKDKIGTGYSVRGQHEYLLIGEKGDLPVPNEAAFTTASIF